MNLLLFRSLCPSNCVTVLSQYLQEASPVRDTYAANANSSSEATIHLDGLSQYDDIKASWEDEELARDLMDVSRKY